MEKKIEDLTFIDDGMFQAVMHEPEICEEFVERLLHVKVEKVVYPELEKQIKPFYTSKGVWLDVYLKDDNKIIDVEIQTYRQDAIGKRTRYYQSMIDIDSLMKGQDYTELLDSYVLFICTYDPFLKDKRNVYGLPCYTFKNTCLENGDVSLVTFAQPKTTCQQRRVVVIFNKERHFAVLRLASIDWKSLRTKPAYSGANTWRAIFLFVYLFFVCDEGAE